MLYAIFCYNDETAIQAWTPEQDASCMERLIAVQQPWAEQGRLGPVARLDFTSTATTLRKGKGEPVVIDGPFAETKEQLLGFYVLDVASLDEAIAAARELAAANPDTGSYEIRPIRTFRPGATLPEPETTP